VTRTKTQQITVLTQYKAQDQRVHVPSGLTLVLYKRQSITIMYIYHTVAYGLHNYTKYAKVVK